MKVKITLLILMLQLVLSAVCFSQNSHSHGIKFVDDIENSTRIIGKNSKVPDFSVTLMNGETFYMSSLKGEFVLLSFFATWCAPCMKDFTYFRDEIWAEFSEDDFDILAIAVSGDTPEKIKNNAFYGKIPFKIGFDYDGRIMDRFFEINSKQYVPYNILIDKDGTVLMSWIGYRLEKLNEMKEYIASLIFWDVIYGI